MRTFGCAVVFALLLTGCPPTLLDVPCLTDSDCSRADGGRCTPADSGDRWCAYPDAECPTGYRYVEDSEDAVSGICVPEMGPQLTVHLGGKGTGAVFSNPPGLTCSGDACTGRFPPGTLVQLSTEPKIGSFLGWLDGCRGNGTCAVTMDSDQSVTALFGMPGEALWARQFGSPEAAVAGNIVVGPDGNLIVVGSFNGTIPSGLGKDLRSNGGSDVFVVKLAASTGDVVWARSFGGAMDDNSGSVIVDAAGGIYLSGSFQGTVDFGTGPHQAEDIDAFVLKLDANGTPRWMRKIGGSGAAFAGGIAARNGVVVVTGGYSGLVTVDTQSFTANVDDFYVLKVSADTGATTWFKSFGGNGSDTARGVAINSNDEIVLAGRFTGDADYGGGTISTPNVLRFHVFLLTLGANGAHKLSKQFGPDPNVNGASAGADELAIDSANNVLITGDISVTGSGDVTADFGCGNILHEGVFMAKYLQTGQCVWAQSFLASSVSQGQTRSLSITFNEVDEIAVTGTFIDSISFGGPTLTASGSRDVFTARFTNGGAHLSSARAGGTGDDVGAGIVQTLDGRVFVSGTFSNRAEFVGETLITAGARDAFVVAQAPF